MRQARPKVWVEFRSILSHRYSSFSPVKPRAAATELLWRHAAFGAVTNLIRKLVRCPMWWKSLSVGELTPSSLRTFQPLLSIWRVPIAESAPRPRASRPQEAPLLRATSSDASTFLLRRRTDRRHLRVFQNAVLDVRMLPHLQMPNPKAYVQTRSRSTIRGFVPCGRDSMLETNSLRFSGSLSG